MRYCHILLFLALLGFQSGPAWGQWLNYPAKGQPRTRDGKVDLKARAPRTRDGKPDLSGVWRVESTSIEEWRRLLGDRFASFPGLRECRTVCPFLKAGDVVEVEIDGIGTLRTPLEAMPKVSTEAKK